MSYYTWCINFKNLKPNKSPLDFLDVMKITPRAGPFICAHCAWNLYPLHYKKFLHFLYNWQEVHFVWVQRIIQVPELQLRYGITDRTWRKSVKVCPFASWVTKWKLNHRIRKTRASTANWHLINMNVCLMCIWGGVHGLSQRRLLLNIRWMCPLWGRKWEITILLHFTAKKEAL